MGYLLWLYGLLKTVGQWLEFYIVRNTTLREEKKMEKIRIASLVIHKYKIDIYQLHFKKKISSQSKFVYK